MWLQPHLYKSYKFFLKMKSNNTHNFCDNQTRILCQMHHTKYMRFLSKGEHIRINNYSINTNSNYVLEKIIDHHVKKNPCCRKKDRKNIIFKPCSKKWHTRTEKNIAFPLFINYLWFWNRKFTLHCLQLIIVPSKNIVRVNYRWDPCTWYTCWWATP